ncbi:MAG: hypothetical protein ACHREM_32610 [Polyangiales bacterium]
MSAGTPNRTAVGFTGTREGFTAEQRLYFETMIAGLALANRCVEFHHGDCQGADAEAHDIVRALAPDWTIHIHPGPDGDPHRAGKVGDRYHMAKGHFARNRDIVRASSLVLGVSVAPHRLDRGGTWYTLDFAVKNRVPTKVLWPAAGVDDLYPLPSHAGRKSR